MPIATATTGERTALRFKDLDYAVDAIRVYVRDAEDNVEEVVSYGAAEKGADVELHFTAPDPGTYDIAAKADVGSETRTLVQSMNALRVRASFGS